MTEANDRRRFLKSLAGDAVRSAREAHQALGSLSPLSRLDALGQGPHQPVDTPTSALPGTPSLPAVPVIRTLSTEELVALAGEVGLDHRTGAVEALAVASVRLTPGGAEATRAGLSRFGGRPDLPRSAKWPTWRREPLQFMLQLDFSDPALRARDDTPDEGLLLLFADQAGGASGLRSGHVRSFRAILADRPSPREAQDRQGSVAIHLSTELSLPRVWSAVVQALLLDEREERAWHELRSRLAQLQGVELLDSGEASGRAPHRLFGYPDEMTGTMPLACELMSRGHTIGGEHPAMHLQARACADGAARWQLLLQLPADPDLGWSWGTGSERLYVWKDAGEPGPRRLTEVRAFRQ